MTDEQILELVKEHFIEWEADEDGYCWVEFAGKPDAFVKFAREFWAEGFKVGVEYGYDEGWESNNVSTKMNTWSSDDD